MTKPSNSSSDLKGGDFTRSSGAAAIGARLRRLSERIDRDAARLYRESGEVFEQRWYGTVQLLAQGAPLSVGDLAAALGVSHASVSQIRSGLAKAGLVAFDVDRKNARLRRLSLTPKGQALVLRLMPLWAALNEASIELNAEVDDVIAAIDSLDSALARNSLYERVKAKLG